MKRTDYSLNQEMYNRSHELSQAKLYSRLVQSSWYIYASWSELCLVSLCEFPGKIRLLILDISFHAFHLSGWLGVSSVAGTLVL